MGTSRVRRGPVGRVIQAQQWPVVGHVVRLMLYARGTDIARSVRIDPSAWFRHGAACVVLHPNTTIGARVMIFHGVTVGRADPWLPPDGFGGVVIEDDVVLGAHATVLNRGPTPMVVSRGSIIGAGSVLLQSTASGEVWAGNPARCVGHREGNWIR